jgi:hypothetical protein
LLKRIKKFLKGEQKMKEQLTEKEMRIREIALQRLRESFPNASEAELEKIIKGATITAAKASNSLSSGKISFDESIVPFSAGATYQQPKQSTKKLENPTPNEKLATSLDPNSKIPVDDSLASFSQGVREKRKPENHDMSKTYEEGVKFE